MDDSKVFSLRDLDEDGYPTEELLARIREWRYVDNYLDLMEVVEANWNWAPTMFERDGAKYTMSTGGWSGNEDIVGALQDNAMFWLCCWVSSRRGGHYEFEVDHG